MKKIIKKLPIIGPMAIKWKQKQRLKEWESTEKYWNERYSTGGTSGIGSYDKLAEHKGEVINEFIKEHNIKSGIELSCGDGNQLGYFDFEKYTGYEIAESAVERCKEMYKDDPSKTFRHFDNYVQEKADLSMSLDVLYCLTEDDVYEQYMNRLFDSSDSYVLIFSTNFEDDNELATYILHRKFTDWVEKNRSNFELVKFVQNKYHDEVKPFISDFYFFKKSI